jgi:magnesium chelatase subunit D
MTHHHAKIYFPFSAIVGMENAKLALMVNAVNPLIGGVVLAGDKEWG